MSRLIATFFYSGLLRPAPGTWGSAAAVLAAWALFEVSGYWLIAIGIPILFFAGWWATIQVTRDSGDHDPSLVVIDEVVGQWIALLPVVIGASHAGAGFWALWPGVLVAFLGFRLFDIWKPGPVGWADKRDDALGVMLDDVFAGMMAAVLVGLGAWVSHG